MLFGHICENMEPFCRNNVATVAYVLNATAQISVLRQKPSFPMVQAYLRQIEAVDREVAELEVKIKKGAFRKESDGKRRS